MSLSRTCRQYAGVIILQILIYISPAFGQDDSYTLDPVTVTADKRSENIQEVPGAVTAFTGTELEDAGSESVVDLFDMIPGLNLQTQIRGWYNVTYRGLGKSAFTGKNPIVIFVDGIPLDSRTDYNPDLLNIERVEFLRGPQGTLYGKNAIGGVINIISKEPDNIAQGKISATYGQNGTYNFKGVTNCPLINDKLFMTLSAKYSRIDGYMTNDTPGEDTFDDQQDTSAKAQFRWVPSDRLNINFRAGVDQSRKGVGPAISSDEITYHAYKNIDDRLNSDGYDSALHINYSASLADFNATTTYRNAKTDFWEGSVSDSAGRLADLEGNTFTQELRMQSPQNDSGIKWVGGLYYSHENSWSNEYGNMYNLESSLGYYMKTDFLYDQDEDTMAVFGQATVPLFGPVNFTVGLRYENNKKSIDYTGTTTRLDTDAQLSKTQWDDEDDWDAFLPKGVLFWNVNSDALLYFSVAQGYLAGGFNNCTDDKDTAKFDEETSVNYEIGAKTSWLDDRLVMNASLFYVDMKDMHVFSQPQPGIWVATNAAKAHSQGVELEVKSRPFQGLDLAGSFSWIRAEYDEYGDYAGNTPTYTPDYTFFLSAQYRHSSGIYVRGEMNGYGKVYYDAGNTIQRDHLELYNAKIGYETGRWDIYLYVDNLTDEEYFTDKSSYSNYVGEPRSMGLTASIWF